MLSLLIKYFLQKVRNLFDMLRLTITMWSVNSHMKKIVDLASEFYGVEPDLIQICISPSSFYSWICWVQIMIVDNKGLLIKSIAPDDNIVGEGKTVEDSLKELLLSFEDCMLNKINIIEKPYLH